MSEPVGSATPTTPPSWGTVEMLAAARPATTPRCASLAAQTLRRDRCSGVGRRGVRGAVRPVLPRRRPRRRTGGRSTRGDLLRLLRDGPWGASSTSTSTRAGRGGLQPRRRRRRRRQVGVGDNAIRKRLRRRACRADLEDRAGDGLPRRWVPAVLIAVIDDSGGTSTCVDHRGRRGGASASAAPSLGTWGILARGRRPDARRTARSSNLARRRRRRDRGDCRATGGRRQRDRRHWHARTGRLKRG